MTLNDIFNDTYLYSNYNNATPLTPISKMLVSLDGIHSGVPTRTTATLTPTTLRNIEQTFFELTNDPPVTIPYQAGFVPPLPEFNFDNDQQDHNSMGSTGTGSSSSMGSWHSPPPAINEEIVVGTQGASNPSMQPSRKTGGRRPKNSANLSPEEEEKRKVRRERNKLAAARCRKRRVDQTNDLLEKVGALEKEKQRLHQEIEELTMSKNELEYVIESHRDQCKMTMLMDRKPVVTTSNVSFKQSVPQVVVNNKIKLEPYDPSYDGPPSPKRILLSSDNPVIAAPPKVFIPTTANQSNNHLSIDTLNTPTNRPSRPSSLNVPLQMPHSHKINIADIAGVPITTPSTGVMFNFDSLMDGGTGLTPVSQPLMPNQQNPLEIVTPTSEPSKLCRL